MQITENMKLSQVNIPNLEVFLEEFCLIPPQIIGLHEDIYSGEVSFAELSKQGAISFLQLKKLLFSYLELSSGVFLMREGLETAFFEDKKPFSLLFLEERSDLELFLKTKPCLIEFRDRFLIFSELDWQKIYPKWEEEQRRVLVLANNSKQAFSAALYFRKQGFTSCFTLNS